MVHSEAKEGSPRPRTHPQDISAFREKRARQTLVRAADEGNQKNGKLWKH